MLRLNGWSSGALILAVSLAAGRVIPAYAQSTGAIQGTVNDAGGQPITNARMTIPGTTLSTATDVRGNYSLPSIPAGVIALRANANGYKPLEMEGIRIRSGQTVTQDFTLGRTVAAVGAAQVDPTGIPMMLRFQLLKSSSTRTTDPAIAGIDSVLKDLFKYPGYRALSSLAVAADFVPRRPGAEGTRTDQMMNGDGSSYHLSVTIDSASSQAVRMNVWLYSAQTPSRLTLLNTTVLLSFGKTLVIGGFQPPSAGQGTAPGETLILTVRSDIRRPE